METRRWTNPSQPQTLYMATWLLYFNAAFNLIFGGALRYPIILAAVVAEVLAAIGIANEKRWGYLVGVGVSAAVVAFLLWPLTSDLSLIFNVNFLLEIIFPIALFALLIHPMSRDYQRIWFK